MGMVIMVVCLLNAFASYRCQIGSGCQFCAHLLSSKIKNVVVNDRPILLVGSKSIISQITTISEESLIPDQSFSTDIWCINKYFWRTADHFVHVLKIQSELVCSTTILGPSIMEQ